MQQPVELANKILSVLEREDFHDAVSALKIAMILLPVKANPSTFPNETPQAPEESAVEV